jgi:hypothetical protein
MVLFPLSLLLITLIDETLERLNENLEAFKQQIGQNTKSNFKTLKYPEVKSWTGYCSPLNGLLFEIYTIDLMSVVDHIWVWDHSIDCADGTMTWREGE